MTDSTKFWNKAAAKYAKSEISDMDAYRETQGRTISHLSPTDRMLEIGCGTGSTALELAPHVAHVTATDIAAAMVDIARDKVAEAGVDNISFHVGAAGDPEIVTEAPFDVAMALNLLHLVPDQAGALRQIHSALKPGGLFISKTACLGEKWYFRPLVTVMGWVGMAPYVSIQREAGVRDAIVNAGFEVVEELSQTGSITRLYMVARKV